MFRVHSTLERIAVALEQTVACLRTFVADFHRVADHIAPPPAQVVGSKYIAKRLGVSTTWIAELARNGSILADCLVKGTGKGKVWRFDREKIDAWIDEDRPGAA